MIFSAQQEKEIAQDAKQINKLLREMEDVQNIVIFDKEGIR